MFLQSTFAGSSAALIKSQAWATFFISPSGKDALSTRHPSFVFGRKLSAMLAGEKIG
jgi:hypothetical protein